MSEKSCPFTKTEAQYDGDPEARCGLQPGLYCQGRESSLCPVKSKLTPCPLRSDNGNCSPLGGFCNHDTELCKAVTRAYEHGRFCGIQEDISRTKTSNPPCFQAETDNLYPLCVGRGLLACAHCCLWADYDSDEDESRVNKPLTMEQLREMDKFSPPIWDSSLNDWCAVRPAICHGEKEISYIGGGCRPLEANRFYPRPLERDAGDE